jgi:hypothetical protein
MRAWESVIVVAVLLAIPARLGAADAAMANLQPWTTGAYEAYVASAEVAFLARVRSGEPVAPAAGASSAGQATDGRIVKVPNGLVHHWRGSIHMPGVGLDRVIATAQRYDAYARMYESVLQARLLRRDGDRFCVLTRVRGSAAGTTVVLEMHSVVRYEREATGAYALGASQDIQEVVEAGQPDERLLPAGSNRGYLWRVNTFTRFVERAGGVDVELETIGLSRRFPRMLGWLIEPIARHLGRRSVERTLTEFGLAVRANLPAEPVPTAAGKDPASRRLTPATPISSSRTSRCDSGSGLG